MVKWQYTTVTGDRVMIRNQLNALGADGWELVEIVPLVTHARFDGGQSLQDCIAYFKRPVQ